MDGWMDGWMGLDGVKVKKFAVFCANNRIFHSLFHPSFTCALSACQQCSDRNSS